MFYGLLYRSDQIISMVPSGIGIYEKKKKKSAILPLSLGTEGFVQQPYLGSAAKGQEQNLADGCIPENLVGLKVGIRACSAR